MTKNFKQNLVDFRGNKLMDRDEKGVDTPISLDTLSVNALLMTDKQELSLPGVEKLKRFNLAQKIYASPEKVELTEEELKLVKDQIGKYYTVLIIGTAWEMLEG
jgi:hypothetical protein